MKAIIAKVSVAAAVALGGLGLALVPSTLAGAAPGVCSGTLSGGTVAGPLTVKSGTSCTLTNETVNGDVIVQPDATLNTNNATINGNLLATKALQLHLRNGTIAHTLSVNGLSDLGTKVSSVCGVTIGGSANIRSIGEGSAGNNELDFGDDAGGCPGNTVKGSVILSGNSAETEVDLNHVTGNVVLSGNTGPVDLSGNTIGGNLSCSIAGENLPKNDEAPNMVAGIVSCRIDTSK